MHRDTKWSRYGVAALFALYLLLVALSPSPWHFPLLGAAVLWGAREWDVTGGAGAALLSGFALLLGLWRLQTPAPGSYIWACALLVALGVVAGRHARLQRAMAYVNSDLKQAQQRLKAVHRIALSLSATLDVNQLLEIILEQLGQLWGYDFGAVLLRDETTGDLVLTAARGYSQELGYRLSAHEGLCGTVLRTGRPVLSDDVREDGRYVLGVADARSELAVPLIWESEIIGVLNVESRTLHAYTSADVTLLMTVAEQAAAAIGNARLHQQARQQAITDAHTGLYNYRHFQEQVTEMVRNAQLTGTPFALIMLDLDHFKRCNDTYGHPTGDAILQQLTRVLRDSCRLEDMLFRYGGEEFAIILPSTAGDVAERVAERIRARIASHTFTSRSGRALDFGLTASIGIASYPKDGMTQIDLVLAADRALYAAKGAGRNRVMLATPGPQVETA